jgi:inosine-uridine nucleoside N-ribohydrolase
MKLVIDTDPGVDDVMAIALAAALDGVEILGLTTVFGNTFVGQSSRNARYLLDQLGLEVPVFEGAALPYEEDSYQPSHNVHGPEGLGGMKTVPDIGQNADESAAEALVRLAKEHKGELVICALAPLTNIADALRLDPEFAQNVGRLVIMGGAFEHPGNITDHAEANIYHDARAADEVLAAGFALEKIGLNVTLKTNLTLADLEGLAQGSPRIGGLIAQISPFYIDFYRSVGYDKGCPIHDATAILACTHPEKFTFVESGLHVCQKPGTFGMTRADDTRPTAKVAVDVDGPWIESYFKDRIATLP